LAMLMDQPFPDSYLGGNQKNIFVEKELAILIAGHWYITAKGDEAYHMRDIVDKRKSIKTLEKQKEKQCTQSNNI